MSGDFINIKSDRRITATQAHTNPVIYKKVSLTQAEADFILFQALVFENKHHRILGLKKASFAYDEKQLRDAAAAEVALTSQYPSEESEKSTRKRKQLNADEKAQQNRDRNREHAKNTRLRKKAYVIKLKELMDQITKEKENEDKEREIIGESVYEKNSLHKHILRTMLAFQAQNCQDRIKWTSILDESIILSMPITPYRSFHKSNVVSTTNKVLIGIDAVMKDVASFAILVESIGQGSSEWVDAIKYGRGGLVQIQIEASEILAAGDYVMLSYTLDLVGVGMKDSINKCTQHGMVQCQFNQANKIVAVEMVFDVMAFMQQLQRASTTQPSINVLPNTVATALQPHNEARCIMKATMMFPIIHVNDAWTTLNGYSQFDTEGKSLYEVLDIVDCQREHFYSLFAECADGYPTSATLIKNAKGLDSSLSLFYFKLSPLTSESGEISHILGVQVPLPTTPTEQWVLKEAVKNTRMGSFCF